MGFLLTVFARNVTIYREELEFYGKEISYETNH